MISTIFEQFVEASPVTVMVRAILERIFRAEKLDELFEQSAEKQYTNVAVFECRGADESGGVRDSSKRECRVQSSREARGGF